VTHVGHVGFARVEGHGRRTSATRAAAARSSGRGISGSRTSGSRSDLASGSRSAPPERAQGATRAPGPRATSRCPVRRRCALARESIEGWGTTHRSAQREERPRRVVGCARCRLARTSVDRRRASRTTTGAGHATFGGVGRHRPHHVRSEAEFSPKTPAVALAPGAPSTERRGQERNPTSVDSGPGISVSSGLGISGSRDLGISGSRDLGISGSRDLGISGSRDLGPRTRARARARRVTHRVRTAGGRPAAGSLHE